MKHNEESGFTLIELIIVIIILGILAATAFPKFQDLTDDAKQAVVDAGGGALLSAAMITYGQNKGSTTLSSILGQTTMENVSVSSPASLQCNSDGTDTSVTVYYVGSSSVTKTVTISSSFCSN